MQHGSHHITHSRLARLAVASLGQCHQTSGHWANLQAYSDVTQALHKAATACTLRIPRQQTRSSRSMTHPPRARQCAPSHINDFQQLAAEAARVSSTCRQIEHSGGHPLVISGHVAITERHPHNGTLQCATSSVSICPIQNLKHTPRYGNSRVSSPHSSATCGPEADPRTCQVYPIWYDCQSMCHVTLTGGTYHTRHSIQLQVGPQWFASQLLVPASCSDKGMIKLSPLTSPAVTDCPCHFTTWKTVSSPTLSCLSCKHRTQQAASGSTPRPQRLLR